MKKLIAFLVLLGILAQSFGQATAKQQYSKEYYLKKSKSEKAGAWVLLVGGGVLAAVGFNSRKAADDPALSFSDAIGADIASLIAIIAGCSFVAVSIPLFVAARKDARKATAVEF